MGKETIEELKEFLRTLNIHNKDLEVCFGDAVASLHIEGLFLQALQSQTQDIIKKVEGMKIEFIPYTKYTGLLSDKGMEKQKMINHGERCYNKAIQKFNQALSAILKEL